MFKLLAYLSLALCLLNVSEELGLVPKGKYLGFLPRWEQSSTGLGAMMGSIHNGLGHLHMAASQPAPLAPVITHGVRSFDSAIAQAEHPDAIGNLIAANQ